MLTRSLRLNLFIALALLFSMMPGVSATAAKTDTASLSDARWIPIVTLPVGAGSGQVGYVLNVEGGANRGPQALSVAPDGRIYVLDSVQQRVHQIYNGQVERTISLPFTLYPLDILAMPQSMYILDSDHRILNVDYGGTLLRAYALPPGLLADQVYRLYNPPGSNRVVLWAANYRQFDLANLPSSVDLQAGVGIKDFSLSGIAAPNGQRWRGQLGGVTASNLSTTDNRTSVDIEAKGIFGTARLIGFDQAAQPYMLVEDLYDAKGTLGVEETVRRYSSNGQMTGVVRLSGEEFVLPPTRYVVINADGSLYVLVPRRNGTTIY